MNFIRRGFTLVEIAIVLIVMGIILTMVVKSRALTFSTSVRSEISKLNKITVAIDLFYVDFRRMPEKKPGSTVQPDQIDTTEMVEKDYIAFEDFASTFSREDWELWDNVRGADNASVMYSHQGDGTRILGARNPELEARFVCSFESLADDRALDNGRGRQYSANGNGTLRDDILTTDAYNSCYKVTEEVSIDYLFVLYSY